MRIALASLVLALRLSAADAPSLDYDKSTPLDLKQHLVTVRERISVSLIDFANPNGGRTNGMLVVPPPGSGKTAGIVWAHSSGYFNQLPDAMLIARDGAVSILVDLSFSTDSPSAARSEMIRSITSLRRALDILTETRLETIHRTDQRAGKPRQKKEGLANQEARADEEDKQSIGLKRVDLLCAIDHQLGEMRVAQGEACLE